MILGGWAGLGWGLRPGNIVHNDIPNIYWRYILILVSALGSISSTP
jgi:hypothetical protein